MKVVGICTDEEALAILKEHYEPNASKCILDQLDGKCFREFLDKAYPDPALL